MEKTKNDLSYDDNGILRVLSTYADGRQHTMWYPNMEVYLEHQRYWKAADHKFYMAVLWDIDMTMEEALVKIDEYESAAQVG